MDIVKGNWAKELKEMKVGDELTFYAKNFSVVRSTQYRLEIEGCVDNVKWMRGAIDRVKGIFTMKRVS